ncbi:hypothetical protein D9M69_717150 [compost metagenome]
MGAGPAARVAPRVAPAAQLLQVGRGHAGLVAQLAFGTGQQRGVAVHIDKAAGQRPTRRVGLARALGASHQQHTQLLGHHREDDHVDRDQGPLEFR